MMLTTWTAAGVWQLWVLLKAYMSFSMIVKNRYLKVLFEPFDRKMSSSQEYRGYCKQRPRGRRLKRALVACIQWHSVLCGVSRRGLGIGTVFAGLRVSLLPSSWLPYNDIFILTDIIRNSSDMSSEEMQPSKLGTKEQCVQSSSPTKPSC